jgi:YidC/Oxa1 family membrane protein insertase
MDEKRLFLAAAVSVALLMAWSYVFPPAKPPRPVQPEVESPAPAAAQPAAGVGAGADTAPRAPVEAAPQQAIQAAEPSEVRVDNGPYEVLLTNRGAVARSWRLRDSLSKAGEPVELVPQVDDGSSLFLGVELEPQELATAINDALFVMERTELPAKADLAAGERFRFSWADGNGLSVTKALEFRQGRWLVDVRVDVRQGGRRLPARLALGPGFGVQEQQGGGMTSYYYASQALWNQRGNVERVNARKLAGEARAFAADLTWAGLEDQYFTALVLPESGAPTEVAWRTIKGIPSAARSGSKEAEPQDLAVLSVGIPEAGAQVFVGPKKLRLLREQGREMEKAVWFSSYPSVAWIARGIFKCLLWIHDHTLHNYGLAIVISTFLLRLLLFPVNQYSMVSMKKTQTQMQRLQPKINAIRTRYRKIQGAEARAKMNQEMMDLYKKEGVNPMGGLSGCLPMLAQLPILIGFYNMLTVAVELRGAPFVGWIRDLSEPDRYWVAPILMGATMFWQQKMAMNKVKDPVQQQQQRIMLIMPFMFTWICVSMPSGLVLYWFVNNLLGIGQQWLVNRHAARLEEAPQGA